MASGMIHLAVTKKICNNYCYKNKARLEFGAVLPDFAENRNDSHRRAVLWGGSKRTYDLNGFREEFREKILEDDLYLGYYLHLIQDVIYRHFVYDHYEWDPMKPGNVERLHNDYSILNRYVRETYDLKNDFIIPENFEHEALAGIADFDPEFLLASMNRFFEEEGRGEIFFFTKEMADRYIELAAKTCLEELEALRGGASVMDSYDLAWENPPASLLESTRNTRDLGGYRTWENGEHFREENCLDNDCDIKQDRDIQCGRGLKQDRYTQCDRSLKQDRYIPCDRYTKYGRILRSDAALDPSEKDKAFLLEHGITTIIDTRTPLETESRPHGLKEAEGFSYRNIPIWEGESIPESVEDVPASYLRIAHSEGMAEVFRCMAEAEGGVMENCSAGKDRTGVISALLLWLCGVRRSDIVYDYMRTKENNRERFPLILQSHPDIDMNIVIPRESFLTDFMDGIAQEHGSVQGFFSDIGIGPELQSKLIRKLV